MMALASRRHFCRIALGLGAAGLGTAPWWCARPLQRAERQAQALGSDVSVVALHEDRHVSEAAAAEALAAIERVDALMSLYRPGNPLCHLNRQGWLDSPHPDLVAILRGAEVVSRQTQGAFDVTVQPLWDLYARAKAAGGLPAADAIETARRRVDWRRVRVSAQRIELAPGMAITLNGIAQGFATDRAMQALRRRGIRHALVNAGELGALGGKSDGDAWTVGIRDPRRPDAHAALAGLRDRCLATSGDYATAFSDDFHCHHIFDPRTGRSPERLASVTVAARTACQADALATAVLVLGPESGLAVVRATPGCDALLIFKNGRTLATERFPSMTQA